MKFLNLFLLATIALFSCTNSVMDDAELNTNPFDLDVAYDFIIIDNIEFIDSTDTQGQPMCYPVISYRYSEEFLSNFQKVYFSEDHIYTLTFGIQVENSANQDFFLPIPQNKIENVDELTVYKGYPSLIFSNRIRAGDTICPIYFISRRHKIQQFDNSVSYSKTQVMECVVCGE